METIRDVSLVYYSQREKERENELEKRRNVGNGDVTWWGDEGWEKIIPEIKTQTNNSE